VRTRLTLLLPSVALATALAACGGGVGKSEFVTKADASCAAGNGTITAVEKPSNAAQVTTAAGTATTTIDSQVAGLRGLDLPGGDDRRQAEAVIAAIGDVGVATKALQDSAGKNDEPAMAKAAVEMRTKAESAANQALAFGLNQCGPGLRTALGNLFDGTRSTLKNAYVAKGEALCRESSRKSDALPQPGSSIASFGRFIDRYVPIYTQLIDGFKALAPPPGDEATVAAIVADFEAALPKIREVGTAAKANNDRLFVALFQELDLLGTQVDAKLDAYGLNACGSAGGY
jgi:hypothetical protein